MTALYKRAPRSISMMLSPSNNNLFTTQVINDLKLHLSWDMSRESIDTRVIYRFRELGILLFLNKIIMDDHKKKT